MLFHREEPLWGPKKVYFFKQNNLQEENRWLLEPFKTIGGLETKQVLNIKFLTGV